jgi:HK97 family phage prohead protease
VVAEAPDAPPEAAAEADGTLRFAGYAALFDKRDAGRDTIRPGAFSRTLAKRRAGQQGRLPLYWQHRPDVRIGWIEQAREDDRGLAVIATIDNPQGGAAAALKAGKVTGLSFGYRARAFQRDAAGRELKDVDLFEVSLVTHPMQHGARVHMIA